jgi:phosphate transport system substrate-binding protein
MSKTSAKRVLIIGVVGGLLGGLVYLAPAFFSRKPADGPDTAKLRTGGSSAVYFVMDRWRKGIKDKDKDRDIDYVSKGSKDGIKGMIDKKYDIGFSHAPLSDEQLKDAKDKGGEVIQAPVGISAIVPIYNLKELGDKAPLNFTADVLAKIFLGDIKSWDDDALKEINKGVELPKKEIRVVYRKDSSGTTLIFTEYLQAASEAWQKSGLGMQDEVKWKTGEGVARSEQLAQYVNRTEGAISYVEVLHAKLLGVQFGAVENKDKSAFIHVRPENMTAAAKEAARDIPENLVCKLTYRAGEKSYPLCVAAWALCYQNQPADRQKMVTGFFNWVIHEGQAPQVNLWTHDPRIKKAAATAFLNKDAVGAISLVEESRFKLGGIGYQSPPKVTISGGGGSGATATAVITGGKVTAFNVTSGGSGYTSPPTIAIDAPDPEVLFAPLPEELVKRIEKRVKTIKSVQ